MGLGVDKNSLAQTYRVSEWPFGYLAAWWRTKITGLTDRAGFGNITMMGDRTGVNRISLILRRFFVWLGVWIVDTGSSEA